MFRQVLLAALCLGSTSCAALDLDSPFEYTDPDTGEVVVTTVGDAMADQVDGAGSMVSDLAGKALGVATGNPVVGVGASALLAALLGTGSSRLRRKKGQGVPVSGGDEAAP
mgnify:CR=1 FL=1